MRFPLKTRWPLWLLWLLPGLLLADANHRADDFSLAGLQGDVSLAQYRGKVVYLDFWASWCGPCRHSFPWMDRMASRYGPDGLVVIAINLDKERALADQFLAEQQSRFTIAFDPQGEVAERYDVQVMPSSYLIDRHGEIKLRHRGFQSDKADLLESEIRALLQQPGERQP
jgi:cytochrome c biogenesis protein CcmG/thiol:disulfide interchange protein DsbE